MTDSTFHTLEAALADDHFPEIDLILRRGRHIGRDDGTAYDYLVDAQSLLEPFYRRFGCELVQQSDGYFYLLPSGDRLGRRPMATALPPPGSPGVLYLVDLSSYVFRAYHAIAPLSNTRGEPTHATDGTVAMLQKLVGERRPAYLAVG